MKECPFCGYDEGWVQETPKGYKVICKVCQAEGPPAKTPDMARRKWDGILNKIESSDKFEEALEEMDMGGVSAPAATLTNVPGVGTAQPASMAATTGAQQYDSGAIGSGDKWGNDKPVKKKKKKTVTKHKISSYEEYADKFPLGKQK